MRLVWPDTFVIEDNLTQQISSLRKALGDHSEEPTYILTIPRRGYRFLADVRAVSDALGVQSEQSGVLPPTGHAPTAAFPICHRRHGR